VVRGPQFEKRWHRGLLVCVSTYCVKYRLGTLLSCNNKKWRSYIAVHTLLTDFKKANVTNVWMYLLMLFLGFGMPIKLIRYLKSVYVLGTFSNIFPAYAGL
jgi:cellulose synthase/poly-beta-1,6-N-acetylglucosamine synthase-like glycosyltransferase